MYYAHDVCLVLFYKVEILLNEKYLYSFNTLV